jgi:hypothetical protein
MKSSTDAAALTWRAPPAAATAVASPWGRRPVGAWAFIVQAWRESIDVYVRTAPHRLPWSPFL